VGKAWRESLALFTLADACVLLNDTKLATEFYRRSDRRTPFSDRRCYFQGHYFWCFLCRTGRIGEAEDWLLDTLRMAEKDDYRWRIALTRLHMGDYYREFAEQTKRGRASEEYEQAAVIAARGEFDGIYRATQHRLTTPGL
jgi:hypothetical protein